MIHPPAAHHAGRRLLAAAGAATLAGTTLVALGAAPAMAAGPVCGTFERADVSDGALVVQNNAWGDTPKQCIAPRDGGFTITTAQGDLEFGGAPKSYPSIFAGEHYGEGSDTASLPVKVSDVGSARSSATVTTAGGAWNAAWDIWVNSSPDSPGENDDTEIMVWANQQGGPTPIGQKVDTITVEGRGYDVWKGTGPGGTDVVSYVDVKTTTTPDISLAPFVKDSISRGATSPGSYLTSVQFGFEPWRGGSGLAVDDFTYTPTSKASATPPADPPAEPAPPGDDEQPAPATTGGRAITGTASGRCLDVAGRSTSPGALAQLWTCQDDNPAQQWAREGDTWVNAGSHLCLDVAEGLTAKGARVQQWTCLAGAPGQQWVAGAGGALVNPASQLCLDAAGAKTTNATAVIVWKCNDAKNQTWTTR